MAGPAVWMLNIRPVRCNFRKQKDGDSFSSYPSGDLSLHLYRGISIPGPVNPVCLPGQSRPTSIGGKRKTKSNKGFVPTTRQNGGVHVKLIRRNVATHSISHPKSSPAVSVYLFYEKTSGTAHFHVEAGPDGELPVDHAAGLLAMHCMVRGQSPADYLIMVPAAPQHLNGLTEKAQKLLEAGNSVKSAVKLTRREEEVLDGILRSLANKEIANELNLSERTVKFHVSSLLAKFKVRSRMELMREASQTSMKSIPAAVGMPATEIRSMPEPAEIYRKPAVSGKILPLSRARMMA
jgi:DNA-binding CsgD family transcriptional regulator